MAWWCGASGHWAELYDDDEECPDCGVPCDWVELDEEAEQNVHEAVYGPVSRPQLSSSARGQL